MIAWNVNRNSKLATKAARRRRLFSWPSAGYRRFPVCFLHFLARLARGQCRHGRKTGSDRRPSRVGYSRRSASSVRGSRARRPIPGSGKRSPPISRSPVASVREQPFTAAHPITGPAGGHGQPDRLVAYRADRAAVVIGAHSDTRPHPDEERRPSSPAATFPRPQRTAPQAWPS